MTDGLAVVIEDEWLMQRRRRSTIAAFTREIRHLVNALVEAELAVVRRQA